MRGIAFHIPESEFADNAAPARPSLPLTLGCALGVWVVSAVALSCFRSIDEQLCLLVGGIGLVLALVAICMLWHKHATQIWAICLGLALGVGCAGGAAAIQHTHARISDGVGGSMLFEVVEDGSSGLYGPTCFARTTMPDGLSALIYLQFGEEESTPRYGEIIEAQVSLSSAEASEYCWREGAVAKAQVTNVKHGERSDIIGALVTLRNVALDLLDAQATEGTSVLAAVICGWREDLQESDAYTAFKVTGLAHLVAVSGAHLSIVAAFVAGLMKLLRMPHKLSVALQLLFLLGYVVLAAAPPSAIRATIMTCAAMLSFTAGRRPAALSALSLCIIGCILASPYTALSISFALSALSTLGIVLFSGLFSAWITHFAKNLPRFVRDAFALTTASSLLALPLSAALFCQVPLVSLAANIVTAPFFPLICTVGLISVLLSVALSAFLPIAGFGSLILGGAAFITSLFVSLVEMLASVPYASIPADIPFVVACALSAVLAVLIWVVWPSPRVYIACIMGGIALVILAGILVLFPRVAADEIIMLDVGQGDAFVVRSRGSTLLIDTGNHDKQLLQALARHGITHLNAVAITHGDDDHMGSLRALRGVVRVDQVFLTHDTLQCSCEACTTLRSDAQSLVGQDGILGLSVDDKVQVGVFTLTVIWPDAFCDEGGNADSMCMRACADVDGDGSEDASALFVGDAEYEQIDEMIDDGRIGSIDIYKVGHHGSKQALDDESARILSPQIALVSVGANNRYGHPAEVTLERLREVGAHVFRTDEEGDVSCKITKERIAVETLR